MSLDNIQLPAFVIADLYTKHLFSLDSTQQASQLIKPENSQKPPFLGNNQKLITLLVQQPTHLHLADADLERLTNILTACKLSIADVAVVNLNNQPLDYLQVTTHFTPSIIICFGVSPQVIGLPINFPTYQIQNFNNQKYLYSAPLAQLVNKQEKLLLWGALKTLFNV
jgi:hypothetical protein